MIRWTKNKTAREGEGQRCSVSGAEHGAGDPLADWRGRQLRPVAGRSGPILGNGSAAVFPRG